MRRRERIRKSRDIELINQLRSAIDPNALALLEELRRRLHELRHKEQQWHDDWREMEPNP